MTVTATDGDGGVTTAQRNFLVSNSDPSVNLIGSVRNGITYITVSIIDPGYELFAIDIYWSQNSSPQSFQTTDHVFTVEHKYLPEELSGLVGTLTIEVNVADDHTSSRGFFNFGNATPQEQPRPSIEPLVQDPPPDRDPTASVPFGGIPEQIVSADLGGHASSGKQNAAAIHQFVLRLVSADGKESGNYPLQPEALADLPNYLKAFGIPDGHYRIYLVTGDIERLVVDGHFRGGHIVDPNEQTAGELDLAERDSRFANQPGTASALLDAQQPEQPPYAAKMNRLEHSVAAAILDSQLVIGSASDPVDIVATQASLPPHSTHAVAGAGQPLTTGTAIESDESAAEDFNFAAIATGVVIAAASGAVVGPLTRSGGNPATPRTAFHRLCKSARFAQDPPLIPSG